MVAIAVLLTIAVSGTNLFPLRFWPQELNANLGLYYFIIHLVSLPVVFMDSVRGRLPAPYTLFVVPALVGLLFFYGATLAPFMTGRGTSPEKPQLEFTAMYLNFHGSDPRYDAVKQLIESAQPKLLFVVGLNEAAKTKLGLPGKFPHKAEVVRGDGLGVGLYSGFPFESTPQESFGEEALPPGIIAQVVPAPNRKLFTALFQTDPLWARTQLDNTKLVIRRLSSKVREQRDGVLIAGEANFTPFSSFFRFLVNDAELDHVMWGKGLFSTFNPRSRYFNFDVDHVMVGGLLSSKSTQVLWTYGLRHPPVVTTAVLAAK